MQTFSPVCSATSKIRNLIGDDRLEHQYILVLDFGGQYNQLIARRVRECGVYCEVKPYTLPLEEIRAKNPVGIIFTGGPNSVYDDGAPRCDKALFELGIPVLGICYGSQLMAYTLGGEVSAAQRREYGKTQLTYDCGSILFRDMPPSAVAWMSHTDYISKLPEGFSVTAHSDTCPVAAMENAARGLYAVQFHLSLIHI